MILIDGLIGKAFQEYENEQKSLTKKAGSKDKVDLQSLADCIMSFSDPSTGNTVTDGNEKPQKPGDGTTGEGNSTTGGTNPPATTEE